MATTLTTDHDGRRLRGDASRQVILTAASQVIASSGVAGVTHRAVAEAAAVPLARVSYHYPRIDDLLLAAAQRYLEGFDERLGELAATALDESRSIVDTCADFLYELVTVGASDFLGTVEVRIALHKRGRVVDDTEVLAIIGSFGIDEQRAASIVAAMFGFAVLAATASSPPSREQVRTYVQAALGVGA